MGPIQTLWTHCLNCLLFPPPLFLEKKKKTGLEHAVPSLYISAILYGRCRHPFQAAFPPQTPGQKEADCPFSQALQSSACRCLRAGGRLLMCRMKTCRYGDMEIKELETECLYWMNLFFIKDAGSTYDLSFPSSFFFFFPGSHDRAWYDFHFSPFGKFPEDQEREIANLGVYSTSSSFVIQTKRICANGQISAQPGQGPTLRSKSAFSSVPFSWQSPGEGLHWASCKHHSLC